MAIEKNNSKASRFDPEFSPANNMYSDEDDVERSVRMVEESDGEDGDDVEDEEGEENDDDEEEEEFNDADSGAGSDDFDLLELGDSGAEFCQVGNVTCSVPFELYDLPGLEDVLSIDVWNEVLTEEEKFGLAKFLPDMDQLTFMQILKELFEGENFHFGSPMKKLFEMLKGGLCEPRVALYREGLSLFQKRQHYHLLRNHQNTMISNICQIRDAWLNCKGYSIEEKLRVLNIMKTQKSMMREMVEEDLESDSMEESRDGVWGKRAKDRRSAQKLGRSSAYEVGPNLDFAMPVPFVGKKVAKHGKQNPKGMLKMAGSKVFSTMESMDQFPSAYQGMDMNSPLYGSAVPVPQQNKAVSYEQGIRQRGKMRVEYDEDKAVALDAIYGVGFLGNQNVVRGTGIGRSGFAKAGKKLDNMRNEALIADGFTNSHFSSKNDFSNVYGRNRTTNQLSEMKTFAARPSSLQNEFEKRAKYSESIQQFAVGNPMKSLKSRTVQLPPMNSGFSLSDYSEPTWHGKNHGQVSPIEPSPKHDDWNISIKKLKKGKVSPDFSFQNYKASSPQVNDAILLSELRTKPLKEKRAKVVQNGGSNKSAMRTMYQNDETESDSSEYFDHSDEDNNPSMKRKSAYFSSMADGSRMSLFKSGLDVKKVKSVKKNMQESEMAFNGITYVPKKVDSSNELEHIAGFLSKSKKGTPQSSSPLPGSAFGVLEDSSPISMRKLKDVDDRKRTQKVGKNGQFRVESVRSVPVPSLKAHSSDRRQKGEFSHYDAVAEEEFLPETHFQVDEYQPVRTVRKGKKSEAYIHDRGDRSESPLQGFSSVTKKRKARAEPVVEMDGRDEGGNVQSNLQQQIDESSSLKKKGKKKKEPDTADMDTSQPSAAEAGTLIPVEEPETKPQKKSYTPITPTVHTGFSFSIIHLLSAVRMAMITPLSEVSLDVGKSKDEQNGKLEGGSNDVVPNENADVSNNSENTSQASVPVLSVPEIVNRVRSNPGDPCILETQEPLQDLIRGVLKIFSSKTAPLGAKAWKPLVGYEKSNKSWSWIGPISQTSTDHETNEEVTSPEYWVIPHKMLVKLVDSFANWLKCGQETLQQIGSLPAPPLSLMQCNLDEKERFRDLRAQKSLNTINPSPEEVRDYFRKEEVLRYSIPDRAFSYTAADGKKSIVAPLRRCGGKPTSKARDHFMLKRDRPPHVTILCLVRDAAARLPGSIGTRADVCTLIRDSQYIVEDVSDAQLNRVVSGALDRLHYEHDPCVQFDGERKLWVYLHREREEEDFEDDGTSSTKKWKRPKKDPADQSDQGTVTVASHGTEDQPEFDLGSDLNVELPSTDGDKKNDNLEVGLEAATLVQDDLRQSGEEKVDATQKLDQDNTDQGDPIAWEALNLNPMAENKLLCQENSTNDDFDDETFGREGPVELLSASLL